MPLDMLIDLYDAHGIPPETVVEMAGDDFTVNVPDNFFTQVAGAHEKDTTNKKDTFKVDYPETELLFYKDFYQKEFEGEVLGLVEKDGDQCLIFDKTTFYPEGEANLQIWVKFPSGALPLKYIMPKKSIMLYCTM